MSTNILSTITSDIFTLFNGVNLISLMIYTVLLYPLVIGFLFKLNSDALLNTIKSLFSTLALLLSLMISSTIVKGVFISDKYGIMDYINTKAGPSISALIQNRPQIFMGTILVILIVIIHQLLKLLIHLISEIGLSPLLQALDNLIKKGGGVLRRIFGVIFQIPRALCYAIILTFLLNYISMLNVSKNLDTTLENSKIYNYFSEKAVMPITKSKLAKSLPNIVGDSFKISNNEKQAIDLSNLGLDNIGSNELVYYNGVTLAQGVKSNDEINATGVTIAAKERNTYDKAKKIYEWVGSKITYDHDKAVQVMSNNRNIESGAIPTFYSKKGVCFDYACLFVAMARANGMKVRLIVGEGFNGKTWISHAWNEVYIPEEDRWVNVDPTFYIGGNYFDNEGFNLEHKNRKVAGEW
ncbi:hypothetical protein J2Z44_001720 [Clostridium punense]|uniref:Transglutaminase-like domain-containing protein n=2 Tax=root TaxID=1 RepID=A0ABS4K2B6_9CLOT|nr:MULTISPECIES: transglutaminase-like domain-containing protein [Clostridium]EQB90164.1 hypothetical protein M918_01390 [Clostridium sp. BL8]MBP2021924.1 hypothetical protein [Clostridium punense]